MGLLGRRWYTQGQDVDKLGATAVHITQVSINNLPPLSNVKFDCDEHVNLFIGPNGSGKSTILRAMNLLAMNEMVSDEQEVYDDCEEDDDPVDPIEIRFFRSGGVSIMPSEDWPWYDYGDVVDVREHMPFLYIPATRISLPRVESPDMRIDTVQDPKVNTPLDNLFDTQSGIFNGHYVDLAIHYVYGPKFGLVRAIFGKGPLDWNYHTQLERALGIGYSCTKRICDEILYDARPHAHREARKNYLGEDTVYPGMRVGTNDDILGELLHVSVLSSGTQGTLLWIYALALKMASHYNWEEGWEKKPAILLIDEIENHLHPTWQRRVIPALLEHFPKLQIFATTHSPFVVAGLKAGQVHLLKRDEDGRVTATTNDKDIIGWTMDEILRTMMGVDDPTDDATAAAAAELRQLRNEWPRSSPEDEEKRQERIAELRQKVDRDLLAGGPLAAQREDFAKRFAEALEKHGIPKNLNLENG